MVTNAVIIFVSEATGLLIPEPFSAMTRPVLRSSTHTAFAVVDGSGFTDFVDVTFLKLLTVRGDVIRWRALLLRGVGMAGEEWVVF